MRYDFAYIEALHARARHARAEAIYNLLIAPVVELFIRPTTEKRRAPRPHLARQG
jgi:hypothetical protein